MPESRSAATDARRAVPRTDAVLADPRLVAAAARLGGRLVKDAVTAAQARCRAGALEPGAVADAALAALPEAATSLHRVVNATGVVVHTNLGRAPLSAAAREAVALAAGPTDVELDLATGRRGPRGAGALAALAAAVPDAGAVHVVNNGAAALALVTLGLAAGRNVVLARGEMVEIGDGFRIPELLESVGATLREVGTTNRVRLADYAAAVDERTAFVLKVHPSNFVVSGFTSAVPVRALAGLPVPVVADIGSGLLAPHPLLPGEPDAATTLREGADLVTASGDKLLGGPQAGLLLGRADLVQALRRHPFARALRVDKLTLAALEATLTGPPPPVRAALETDPATLLRRAEAIAALLADVGAVARTSVAAVGGGGAPGVELPSAAVTLPVPFAAALRRGRPAVVGRVERDRLLLDLRTVPAEQDEALLAAVRAAAATLAGREDRAVPTTAPGHPGS
ncbi:L-seryl-tRNA(Sec) selenium transferase [Georgenia sp. EYE_87]|uniref:L-seryl-tRNA(Sec) selenium transferase n=1 Tax=Georgenia sp. EYE_87 TaxID=2853448 RepID=UPI002006780E|nr:L-seryl-tRNA(Sec) selenium transferase [Georgenia sp. EYE_87]MCK6209900.1 L-seryl-tRNA(Sec) selenium transferase [Georgenia sp. EYE_87]